MNKEQFGLIKFAIDGIFFDMAWGATKDGEGEMPDILKEKFKVVLEMLHENEISAL
jgi:hypothetical protein